MFGVIGVIIGIWGLFVCKDDRQLKIVSIFNIVGGIVIFVWWLVDLLCLKWVINVY